MRVALAQLNPVIGDFPGNESGLLAAYQRGVDAGVDLVVGTELGLCGYPPRDLLLRPAFIAANEEALLRLAAATATAGTGLLVGYVGLQPRRPGRGVSNSVALLQHGRVQAVRTKSLLPTYDVFDEDRYFEPARENRPVEFNGHRIGLTICEDVWNDEDFWPDRRYRPNPAADLVEAGAEVIFNLSASPWNLGKERTRHAMLASLAHKTGRPLVYCNAVGGNDELIFDGRSLVFNGHGELICEAAAFAPDFRIVDTSTRGNPGGMTARAITDEESVFQALVLGTRDYLGKCGFTKAVLGLSGGIDSAVVAVLATAALGYANVHGISLPSRYSSPGSLEDARVLAQNLGIRYDVVPIESAFAATRDQLAPLFADRAEDTTEENIQARLRGVVLMAMSNKFGSLLLTTGNKSELAVGYCTLYGDMCGGLAMISDVPKTLVYRLARWINREREIIPSSSITKPPSAELRPNQTDQDNLPAYEILDDILERYVVKQQAPAEILSAGHTASDVKRVIRLIDGAEYKRRQAAPGLKITTKAFGVGRRIPVAQRWREI